MEIWSCPSYRAYLIERLGPIGSRTGLRKKLAEAIPVHTTFVSQVLGGQADLSLEQAEVVNDFFQHTEREGEFFIWLVLRDRASSPKLKARFEKKIEAAREQQLSIKNKLRVDNSLTEAERQRFYTSHIYGAVHVLVSLPEFRTTEALARALHISKRQVSEIVDFLLDCGLVQKGANGLEIGSKHVHLSNDTELVLRHHSNWRAHTLAQLQFLDREDLHYSACVTLSKEDVVKVKELILDNLKKNVEVISASQEETAYVLSFDFYKLVR